MEAGRKLPCCLRKWVLHTRWVVRVRGRAITWRRSAAREGAKCWALIEDVKIAMEKLPGVQDVDTSLEDGEEEIHVEIDRLRRSTTACSAKLPRVLGGS